MSLNVIKIYFYLFVYVCSGRKIVLMSVNKNSSITLMKTLQTTTEVDSICPYDVNRFIVGTVGDRRHARMIGLNGQESDILSLTFPDKTYDADPCHCTYLPSDGVLAVTDVLEHTVQLYQIVHGTSRTVKDDRIQLPTGICGAQGRVFVASRGTNTVVEMTVHGEIVKCHDVGMKWPRTISVTQDGGHMVVASNVLKDSTIKLFKMEYA